LSSDEIDTLILGIGNILWADEGFGVRCVEALNAAWEFPQHVRLMDGGTQGMFLLPWVSSVSRLLIFDAIDFGVDACELRLMRDNDVPQYMGAKKVSMHQTGFQEVLAGIGTPAGWQTAAAGADRHSTGTARRLRRQPQGRHQATHSEGS
jgi:hydrogenase maturation protease